MGIEIYDYNLILHTTKSISGVHGISIIVLVEYYSKLKFAKRHKTTIFESYWTDFVENY